MSQAEIEEIVYQFRKSTCDIRDEEVESILRLCRRKMEITGRPKGYMKLLLPDELKNYCFRMAVNMDSLARMAGKECEKCAACVR